MKTRTRIAIAAFTLVLAAPMAQAHRQWLLPSATVLSGEDPWVSVDGAISNDLFYPDHHPMRLDNLSIVAPDGSAGKAENAATGKYRSVFDVQLSQPGTYRVASVSDMLMASYKQNGEQKRWRGSKAELDAGALPKDATDVKLSQNASRVEIFVTRGAPDEGALKPTNAGLELIPVTHPNDLFAGEEASFKLLVDGKPAADVEVSIVPGAARYRDASGEVKVKTAADGSFKYTWPEAGMYWVNASVADLPSTIEGASRRAGYTATLEVLKP